MTESAIKVPSAQAAGQGGHPRGASTHGRWARALVLLSFPVIALTPGYGFGIRTQSVALLAFCVLVAAPTLWTRRSSDPASEPLRGSTLGGLRFGGLNLRGLNLLGLSLIREVDVPTLGAILTLIAAVLGVLVADQAAIATSALLLPIGLFLSHSAARQLFQTPRAIRGVLFGWLITGSIIATLGLIGYRQFLLEGGEPTSRSRLLSTVLYPHSYVAAQAILPALPLAITGFLYARRTRFRIANGLATATIGAFLVLTHSRAIWLATSVGALSAISIAMAARSGSGTRARRLMRRVAIFAGAATLALAPFALTDLGQGALVDITERAGDLWRPKHHETHLSRIQVWKSSASLAADHLPLGVGPGQFSSQLEPVYPGVGYAVHAHNQLIHTFVETGAIGVVGLLLLVLASIRTGLTAAFAGGGQRDRRILLVGATASLIAVTVHAQFESPLLVAPGVIAVGILTGALSAQATAGTSQTGPRRPRRSRQIVCALLLPIAAVQCVDTIAGVRSYRALAALQASPGQTPEDAERAVTLADSATEAAPYLPFTWLVAAHARRSAGDLIGTAAAYGRHEQLSPGVPTTVYQHAATLAMIGRFSDAIPLLERARRRSPDKRDAITLDLATSLLGAERPGEALVLLMELARAGYFAADPTVLRRMAECRIALGTGRVAALQALAAYENRLAPKEDPAVPILRKLANDLP